MVKKNSKLHGVLPVLQTPFHEDESIDWPTLEREIAWVFEKKADGIVLGMVSEILRLSHSERQMLTEKARQFTGNRGQVIVSVGAESGKVAEELARHAEGAGADGVMAAPPISSGASEEELFRYYQRIVGAIWGGVVGPLRWMDLTGLPIYAEVMQRLFPTLDNSTTVPRCFQQLLDSGARGANYGRGFFKYTPEEEHQWHQLLAEHMWNTMQLRRQYADRFAEIKS